MQSSALPIHWASADAMLLVKADFSALRRRTPSSRRLLSETVTANVSEKQLHSTAWEVGENNPEKRQSQTVLAFSLCFPAAHDGN